MILLIRLKLFLFFVVFFCGIGTTRGQHEIPTETILIIESLENKTELYTAFESFCNEEDSLKFKALCFLIDNMSSHVEKSYYFVDDDEEKVVFDELNYKDFRTSLRAFEKIKEERGKLEARKVTISDIETMQADYLVANINLAFESWSETNYDFKIFCEYILPYRVNVEPLYDWREKYNKRFSKIIDTEDQSPLKEKIKYLVDNINLWFVCTFGIEKRKDPLPRLGSLQLLHRKKGTCEDVAALSVFALRSLGIASTVDVVPFWGTSTGGHTLNCAFDYDGTPIHFDVLDRSDSLHNFVREPAKVFRSTYSIQKNSLANQVAKNNIPSVEVLKSPNYIDVTEEYWKTQDVECKLEQNPIGNEVVYACTFNGMMWLPVWWTHPIDNVATFKNMGQGVVYLPKYYRDSKMVTAGYPIAAGYKETKMLKPSKEKQVIRVKELPGYLKFRPGKKYTLAYYDYGWKQIVTRRADEDTKEFIINNVPKNALLLLVPNYEEKKIRPFTINDKGERLWW